MSWNISEKDIDVQVREKMAKMGVAPQPETQLIFDGEIHIYNIKGVGRDSLNGAYCIYPDNRPAGWIYDWERGQNLSWKYDISGLGEETRSRIHQSEDSPIFKDQQEKRRQDDEQKRATLTDAAHTCFEQAPEAQPDHLYLQRKNINAYGLRQHDNYLLVPLRDENGVFRSMQRLSVDEKHTSFEAGCPIDGYFFTIAADLREEPVLICEEYATGATLHEMTGYTVVCAMNSQNIVTIAQKIKKLYTGRKIFVAADNDHNSEVNAGIKDAVEAVKKCKLDGHFFPKFPEGHDGSNWNDYAMSVGPEKTEAAIKKKIEWLCRPEEERKILSGAEVYNAAVLSKKEFPPMKWAVNGVLPEGCSILFAPPKEGKSIFCMGIALAVAIGGMALGKIPVERGSVCYLALEDTPRRLQTRILGSGIRGDTDLSKLDFVTKIRRQDEGGLRWLDIWLREHQDARLVIIDTLQKFRKLLANNSDRYASDYNTVAELKNLFDKYKVASIMVHHKRKQPDEDWLNTSSGSQGITGAADTIISIDRGRGEKIGVLRMTGRDVAEEELAMSFNPESFSWCLEGPAEEYDRTKEEREVIEYLKKYGERSPKELATALDVKPNTMQQRLKRMYDRNFINSDSGKYYIVAPKQ